MGTLFYIRTLFAEGYYYNYMLLNPQKELLRHPGKRKCKYLDKNEYFCRRRGNVFQY